MQLVRSYNISYLYSVIVELKKDHALINKLQVANSFLKVIVARRNWQKLCTKYFSTLLQTDFSFHCLYKLINIKLRRSNEPN